jgi:hypothetical protein
MTSNNDGIPKMTTDCKELFSIFMKIGGMFSSDFETNRGKLWPQNIVCNNLHEIHDELHKFEEAHRHYPRHDKLINKTRDVKIFDVEFDKNGQY